MNQYKKAIFYALIVIKILFLEFPLLFGRILKLIKLITNKANYLKLVNCLIGYKKKNIKKTTKKNKKKPPARE